ncbi:MAG: VanZ family protein [Clostridia bacterium]|nr:VanZ family protein [Clostridia bacterium]
MKSRIVWWILTALCALLILGLSSQSASQSSGLSNSLAQSVLEKVPAYQELTPEKQAAVSAKANDILRDIAHVVTFMALGFCASMLIRCYAVRHWAAVIFPVLAAFAVLDESVQHWSNAGRAFQFIDLLKDWLGGLLGMMIVALIGWIIRQRKREESSHGVSSSGT